MLFDWVDCSVVYLQTHKGFLLGFSKALFWLPRHVKQGFFIVCASTRLEMTVFVKTCQVGNKTNHHFITDTIIRYITDLVKSLLILFYF